MTDLEVGGAPAGIRRAHPLAEIAHPLVSMEYPVASGTPIANSFPRMKRLVWLIVTVFATLLTRVEPADLPATKAPACCCSEGCDMPKCPPPPANNPAPVLTLQTPAQAIPSPARRAVPPRGAQEKFFARFDSRPAAVAAPRAVVAIARAASVPLFAAHCSFLI